MTKPVLLCFFLLSMLNACESGPPSYEQNIQSAISGGGNVFVRHLDGGVVLLTGWVEDLYTRNAVLRAALKGEGVLRVINHIAIQPRDRFWHAKYSRRMVDDIGGVMLPAIRVKYFDKQSDYS